ncbi:MAG: hypothetical protein QG665_522 [Patescibacteria group bacterium]|nr:hypothetical protein [Patescibacteria group bacterium]
MSTSTLTAEEVENILHVACECRRHCGHILDMSQVPVEDRGKWSDGHRAALHEECARRENYFSGCEQRGDVVLGIWV